LASCCETADTLVGACRFVVGSFDWDGNFAVARLSGMVREYCINARLRIHECREAV